MKFSKSYFTIDTHTAGHPERVITGGLPSIPGETMTEKRNYIREKLDYVRNILTHEPRGHSSMHCSYITEPINPEADMGVIFMGATHYGDMCGHGTIATVTALIETGIIDGKEGDNEVNLDIPGVGLVRTIAKVKNGKVKNVTLRNAPSFLYEEDVRIEVPSIGIIKGDVAYGGNWYFYLQAKELGVKVRPEEISSLLMKGTQAKEAADDQIRVEHPAKSEITCKFLGVIIIDSSSRSGVDQRNILIIGPRHFDRSPCGTGTCGRLAILYSKGKLKRGEKFVNESILGTTFTGSIVDEVSVGRYAGIVPEITGSAYITGFHQFVVDPEDPLREGFYL
ncbi:MAG: proline racemase [Candidatus Aenigmarchaeota archaeon]|nr:proline racemase [Candidatus Aenigmarchaeota archaeon]